MNIWIPDFIIRLFAPHLVERVAREGEVKVTVPLSHKANLEATARGDGDDNPVGVAAQSV